MKIYISLPITGQEREAREHADMVKSALSRKGYKPVSPFDIYAGKNPTYADYLCRDLRALADCDAILLCEGWERSRGCRIEADFAREFGKKILYENEDHKFHNSFNCHFINACDQLAKEFCKTLDVSDHPGDAFWISYGVTFAFQCFEIFVNAEEMMLVIEHKMTYADFSEWYWEWVECDDDGNPLPGRISLNSWLMGARYNNDKEKES